MVLRKCTICDRKFKKTEHFKRHERSHTKERPYECTVCHKRFSRSDVLSRHAKGHNQPNGSASTVARKDSAVEQSPDRRASLIAGASPMLPGPEHGTPLLPAVGLEVHQIHNLSTPRDMNLSATGIPSSSLDFLADISAHHGRAEPDINSMILDEQQPYFGWNEVTPGGQNTQQNSMAFDAVPNDMLQLWLEPRTDTGSNHGSLDLMRDGHFPIISENAVLTPDPQNRNSVDSGKSGCDNIPIERFTKVQRCWLAPPNHTGRLMNSLWRDIVYTDADNLFSVNTVYVAEESSLLQGSRCGVDDDCRRRLQAAFGQTFAYPQMQSPRNGVTSPSTTGSVSMSFANFPPAEILDMALDLYFRTFHPLVPFVHLPTFSAKKTRLPLLFVMCLIGMMLLGTKGTANFVSRNFTVSAPV
ncbi:Transcriptional regulator MNL1 [Penicillium subrubescens]|uniref:Transcriptional regulator MNL1 n=1 Tax=Penicillium subrubescens TaxID=1316194 RepID=A0A1Q5UMN7_9EURO|nr:Transcriptional regulator MNL1 [Penicillium subrubescens]